MSVSLEDVKAVLENKDRSVGHIMDRTLKRDADGKLIKAEDGFGYIWGDYEPVDFEDGWLELDGTPIVIRGNQYEVKELATTGGMDEGSGASVVFEIDGSIFKKEGYYASHYGYDWDGDLYEVEPQEKTITVYKKVR